MKILESHKLSTSVFYEFIFFRIYSTIFHYFLKGLSVCELFGFFKRTVSLCDTMFLATLYQE